MKIHFLLRIFLLCITYGPLSSKSLGIQVNLINVTWETQSNRIRVASPLQILLLNQMKPYSGLRKSANSHLQVYWYDHTVAVVEVDEEQNKLSCEIMDTVNTENRKSVVNQLSKKGVLYKTTFVKMVKLITKCRNLDSFAVPGKWGFYRHPLGLDPEILWCGPGNKATSYHNLGSDAADRCCRSHDLCPRYLSGFGERYGLSNPLPYSISHCLCDRALHACFRETDTPLGRAFGYFFFNVLRAPCIEDTNEGPSIKMLTRRFP